MIRDNQNQHWWHRSKREILNYLILPYLKKNLLVLDYGCGAGNNLIIFNELNKIDVFEKRKLAKKIIKKNFKNVKVINKLTKTYDIILCSDVLEHINNDKLIIDTFYKHLKKNGKLIITVPANPSLFTNKDKEQGHYRRYQINDIKILFKNFKNIYLSYYNFYLFFLIAPLLFIMNLFNIKITNKVEKKPNVLTNKLLFYIFSSEKYIIKKKIRFPIGLSLIGIFTK